MSTKGDIALKIKMGSCNISDLETMLRSEDIEVIQFNKESYKHDESSDSDLTREQIEAIDRIISGNDVKRFFDSPTTQTTVHKLTPIAENVDFIQKGKMVIRVMDKHNFYEAMQMTEEYLKDAPIGLLTKLWISISKSLKE